MFDAYETNHDGDGETFLMSPFEIAIEGMWTGLRVRTRAGRRAGSAKDGRRSHNLLCRFLSVLVDSMCMWW